MKVLITGAAGYLGSQLVNYLLLKGHQVKAFDIMYYGAESLLFGINNNNLEIIKGDIRNKDEIDNAMKSVDCVVHLAAIVGEPACNTNKPLSWSINYDAAKLVIDIANINELKNIIFVSTCSNYGVSDPDELANESSPLNPLSDYAKAKISVEKYLSNSCTIPFTILRLGTLCGLSLSMRFDLLVNEMARSAALGQEIEVYSPNAWRPYLHMNDVIHSIEKIVITDDKSINGDIFNVVGCNLKKSDLVKIVHKYYPDTKIKITDKVPDLRDYRVNGNKFSKKFGEFEQNSIEKAFLEVANAVKDGYFLDPESSIHSAIPYKPFK